MECGMLKWIVLLATAGLIAGCGPGNTSQAQDASPKRDDASLIQCKQAIERKLLNPETVQYAEINHHPVKSEADIQSLLTQGSWDHEFSSLTYDLLVSDLRTNGQDMHFWGIRYRAMTRIGNMTTSKALCLAYTGGDYTLTNTMNGTVKVQPGRYPYQFTVPAIFQ
jgi:hypothetical protein